MGSQALPESRKKILSEHVSLGSISGLLSVGETSTLLKSREREADVGCPTFETASKYEGEAHV